MLVCGLLRVLLDKSNNILAIYSYDNDKRTNKSTEQCVGYPITFTDSSTVSGNSVIASFSWSFGDGTTDTSRVPAPHTFYAYTQDTVYYISLIAINDCGTNTYVDSVLVHPNTTNAFFNTSPDKGCAPLTVTFTNYSIGGTIYAWDFGDGNVSNLYNTTHTYVNPGTYTASFIITNNCSYDTAYVSIEVWPQPTLSFISLHISLLGISVNSPDIVAFLK